MSAAHALVELDVGRRFVWLRAERLILLIFLLAYLLRAVPNLWLEWSEPGWHAANVNEMEFYYDDVARSLLVGKGFVHSVNPRSPDAEFKFTPGTPFHFVPPLYAWLLGIEYFVFGPNLLLAKLVQSFLDSLACVLIYKIGVKTTDRKTGLIAAALYAVYPLAIYTDTRLYYQTLLNLSLCWLVLGMTAPVTIKNGMWTGVALGVSALAKPITLPFVLFLPLIRVIEGLKAKIAKPAILWSLFLVLAVALTLAPWTIRNYIVFDRFIPVQSGGGSVFIQGSKEEYVDLDVNTLRRKYGQNFGTSPDQFASTAVSNHLAHLKSDPLDYLRFLGKKFLLAWYNTEGKDKNTMTLLIQLPFLFFALLGLAASLPLWLRRPNWYIVGLIAYVSGLQVILFPLARYTIAIAPLLMLVASSGINKMLGRYINGRTLE